MPARERSGYKGGIGSFSYDLMCLRNGGTLYAMLSQKKLTVRIKGYLIILLRERKLTIRKSKLPTK